MKRVWLLCLTASLFACGQSQSPETDSTSSPQNPAMTETDQHHDEIAWHKGNVAAAFKVAQQQNKPLFFYWGAEWCPPCQEIKNTVFKHPKFISLSQLFIPVYLDGDTEQAQLVGEQFAVQGYPTMIVFNSAGEEVTRIPGGIDTRRYLDVLALSVENGKKIDTIIADAKQHPDQLSNNELTQLAFYSWWQDNLAIGEEELLSLLKPLAFLPDTSDAIAVPRLMLTYLSMQVDMSRDDLTADEKSTIHKRIKTLLDNRDSVVANADLLSYYPAEIVTLLNLEETEQDALIQQWIDRLEVERGNPVLSKAEQLATLLVPVSFYWLQNPEAETMPPALTRTITAKVAEVNGNTDGDERQSVINRAANILRAAKLYPQVRELVSAELAISKSPYYFMSSMAEIAEETGDAKGAVDWRRQAYEAATGKATRFQWGVEYVSALVEHQPQRAAAIAETSKALFNHLDKGSDVFTGRNYGRLNTLLDQLQKWQSESRPETLSQILNQLQTLCEQTEGESRTRQQCTVLLANRRV